MPANFDDELSRITTDLNRRNNGAKPADPPPAASHDFVDLSLKVADSMVESVEQLVTQAQSMLAEAKARAEKIRAESKEWDEKMINMNARMRVFGAAILAAHKQFHEDTDAQSA